MKGCVEGKGNGNRKYNFIKLLNIIVCYFGKKTLFFKLVSNGRRFPYLFCLNLKSVKHFTRSCRNMKFEFVCIIYF